MTTDDYEKLVWLQDQVTKAKSNVEEASKPWEAIALQIASERSDVSVSAVRFEEDRVRYTCHGTGIYSSDEWYEYYPVVLLFARLGVDPPPTPGAGILKLETMPEDGSSFFNHSCDCSCKCRVTHVRRRAETIAGPRYWCSHCWDQHKPQEQLQNA